MSAADFDQDSNENRLLSDITYSNAATLLITDVNATVLYANNRVVNHTGFSPAEVIGKNPGNLWGGRMSRSFYERLWRTIKQEKRPFVDTVENHTKNGKGNRERIHLAPVLDGFGAIHYFIEMQQACPLGTEPLNNFSNAFVKSLDCETSSFKSALTFILSSLGVSSSCMRRASTVGDSSNTQLFDFIDRVLVAPTQARFHDRLADKALVAMAQQDQEAFAQLYEKYCSQVRTYFMRHLNDRALADDLVHEVFLRALKALPRFNASNASYLTYLLRIAHNMVVNHYRAQVHYWEDIEIHENKLTQEVDYAMALDGESLWKSVSLLPKIEQEALEMYYRQGFSVHAIAMKLAKSDNAIKLILSRSRKRIRGSLGVATD